MLGNGCDSAARFGKCVCMHPTLHRSPDLGVGKPMFGIDLAVTRRPVYRQAAEPEGKIGDRFLRKRLYLMNPHPDRRWGKPLQRMRIAVQSGYRCKRSAYGK